jgi:hypothetical protein
MPVLFALNVLTTYHLYGSSIIATSLSGFFFLKNELKQFCISAQKHGYVLCKYSSTWLHSVQFTNIATLVGSILICCWYCSVRCGLLLTKKSICRRLFHNFFVFNDTPKKLSLQLIRSKPARYVIDALGIKKYSRCQFTDKK